MLLLYIYVKFSAQIYTQMYKLLCFGFVYMCLSVAGSFNIEGETLGMKSKAKIDKIELRTETVLT